jgi:murein DD-endopeptidase MepM/ murein hydrolase activator NlpD
MYAEDFKFSDEFSRLTTFGYSSSFINYSRRRPLGVDMAAQRGATVFAPAAGTVLKATWCGGYGKCILIQHDDTTYRTRYAHLSAISVKEGDRVEQMEKIGEVGNTGRSISTHLRYEVIKDEERVDPRDYIKAIYGK